MIKRECKKCGVVWSNQNEGFSCECGETIFLPVKSLKKLTANIQKLNISFEDITISTGNLIQAFEPINTSREKHESNRTL